MPNLHFLAFRDFDTVQSGKSMRIYPQNNELVNQSQQLKKVMWCNDEPQLNEVKMTKLQKNCNFGILRANYII